MHTLSTCNLQNLSLDQPGQTKLAISNPCDYAALVMETNSESFSVQIIPAPLPRGSQFPDLARSVDYGRHPAYQTLVTQAGLFLRLRALGSFVKTFTGLLAKRITRYEMIPYDLRNSGGLAMARQGLKNALRLNSPTAPFSGDAPVLASLRDHGIAVVQIDEQAHDRLEAIAAAHFDMLTKRRKERENETRQFEDSRSTVSRTSEPELFDRIESLLHAAGIMDAASAYLGRAVQLADVNPQINDASDSFWRDIFPDMPETPLSPTAYYHRDASGGDLKAIFYISDVGPKNGPFTYVLGSHQADVRRIDDLICEANDHGLSATDRATRSLFAALPKALRRKGSFGNDLEPGSDAARLIAERSWSIEGPAGSIVLFDTKGIHRGGMVEHGERRVITCVLG